MHSCDFDLPDPGSTAGDPSLQSASAARLRHLLGLWPPVLVRFQSLFCNCDICYGAFRWLALCATIRAAVSALGFALCRHGWRAALPDSPLCVAGGFDGAGDGFRSRTLEVLWRGEEEAMDGHCSRPHIPPGRCGGTYGPDHATDPGRADGVSVLAAPEALSACGSLLSCAGVEA